MGDVIHPRNLKGGNAPEISILLPSLRPEAVLQRIKEFSITDKDLNYEIIVVSPFAVEGDRVIHIYEEKQRGTVFATNIAYKNSSAQYIVYYADDVSPTTNCLANMLAFVKSKKEPFIGSFRLNNRQGRETPQWSAYNRLYACLGCASKKTIDIIGGLFDPIFNSFWADPDMALRTWTRGGTVEVCPNAYVEVGDLKDEIKKGNLNKYFNIDTKTFLNRWNDTLGKGLDKEIVLKNWTIINKPVYGIGEGFRIALFSWLASIPYLRKIKHFLIRDNSNKNGHKK